MANVTPAHETEGIALLLTTVSRLHRRLGDFTTGLHIAYDFGDGSGLVPSLFVEEHPAGPELRLEHRFGFFARGDADGSELRFRAGVTVTPAGYVVTAAVEADLELPRGEYGAGVHTLHRERAVRSSLTDALSLLEEQVAAVCAMDDVPGRLGFATR
ncbi:hypothetical protein GTU99_02050 [Streptomyces sp. PRKS01-65]|nr:hypothetical protein [Streptomyces harenosi]NEY30998.1 hypothetical protein [Streptomyces harenosi]